MHFFPNLSTDLLMVYQSKGKFGGGSKRIFKQTQKKTQEGISLNSQPLQLSETATDMSE